MRSEAAARAAERRRREDEAPRLTNLVPKLESLKLEIEEHHAGVRLAESVHVKRVSIPHAPALFDLPCLDSFCKDGGHDMTDAILRAQLAAWDKVTTKKAEENAMFKKVMDSMRTFAQRSGRWKNDTDVDFKMAWNHYFAQRKS